MSNPFKFGSIVSGEYFYNREEELLRIKQTLSGGNNITLYAPRRYGKTSLVKKALNDLEKQGFITVYLDFMRVFSKETFIEKYSQAIAAKQSRSLEKAVKSISGYITGFVPSVSFDSSGSPSFSISWIKGRDTEKTLSEVIDLPQKLASNKSKWIIAFDEFQEISKLNGENFEAMLRSHIQDHQNVSYVFFGSKTHLLKDMFNKKNRPFYNSSFVLTIDKIAEEKSVHFLKERFRSTNIEIDDQTTHYILEKAENIPYYIQFLAHEIWQEAIIKGQNKVAYNQIDEAVETILKLQSDYYWELTNRQTSYRKKVLKALCKSSNAIFSYKVTEVYGLGASSSTQKALEVLMDEGIIEKQNNNYFFTDPIYKTFLIRNI